MTFKLTISYNFLEIQTSAIYHIVVKEMLPSVAENIKHRHILPGFGCQIVKGVGIKTDEHIFPPSSHSGKKLASGLGHFMGGLELDIGGRLGLTFTYIFKI